MSGPICQVYPHHREVCCLSEIQVKDIRKLPGLIWSSDYYSLLIFHAGGGEAVTQSKRNQETSGPWDGWWGNLGHIFFPLFFQLQAVQLKGIDGCSLLICGSMPSVTTKIWVFFFGNGMAYTGPGLLSSNGRHLSQSGRRIFVQEISELINRALN